MPVFYDSGVEALYRIVKSGQGFMPRQNSSHYEDGVATHYEDGVAAYAFAEPRLSNISIPEVVNFDTMQVFNSSNDAWYRGYDDAATDERYQVLHEVALFVKRKTEA